MARCGCATWQLLLGCVCMWVELVWWHMAHLSHSSAEINISLFLSFVYWVKNKRKKSKSKGERETHSYKSRASERGWGSEKLSLILELQWRIQRIFQLGFRIWKRVWKFQPIGNPFSSTSFDFLWDGLRKLVLDHYREFKCSSVKEFEFGRCSQASIC